MPLVACACVDSGHGVVVCGLLYGVVLFVVCVLFYKGYSRVSCVEGQCGPRLACCLAPEVEVLRGAVDVCHDDGGAFCGCAVRGVCRVPVSMPVLAGCG